MFILFGYYFVILFCYQKGWLVNRVDCNSKGVVEQFWNYSCEQRTANFKTRISVNLNKVHFEVLVDHEVVAKYFKTILVSFGINLVVNCSERICH